MVRTCQGVMSKNRTNSFKNNVFLEQYFMQHFKYCLTNCYIINTILNADIYYAQISSDEIKFVL